MQARAVIGLALILSGCWYQQPAAPTTSELLARCREEALDAFYDGATAYEAEDVYERCKLRERL